MTTKSISTDMFKGILDRVVLEKATPNDFETLKRILLSADSTGSDLSQTERVLQIGKYNINIGEGHDIQIGDRTYVGWSEDAIQDLIRSLQAQLPKPKGIPESLPRSGVIKFTGRDQELDLLHNHLKGKQHSNITSITGMGGVGKTELALQYTFKYKQEYLGGICWLQSRENNIGIQLIQFVRSRLQLDPPSDLELLEQVGFCWRHWIPGEVLIIVDDVVDYATIRDFLPPTSSRFHVLITTRLRLGSSIEQLSIDVLNEAAALDILMALAGTERIHSELRLAKTLCLWLGYLPLGIELVGRYLERKPDLTLNEIDQRLQAHRLTASALEKPDTDMTHSLGVISAFELSWETLPKSAKHLAYLLSLFAVAPFPWKLATDCLKSRDAEAIEELRDDNLTKLHLVHRKGRGLYQLHQLIREFIQLKAMEEKHEVSKLRKQFCLAMADIGESVPESPTLDDISKLAINIPHMIECGEYAIRLLPETRFIDFTRGLGRFYESQGLYDKAEHWHQTCLREAVDRFGLENLVVASSLSNLGSTLLIKGKYSEVESHYQKALEIRERLFHSKHVEVAESLNDLAILKKYQGEYDGSENLYLESLEIRTFLFGKNSIEAAESLNNIGLLYEEQGKYNKAKETLNESLKIRQSIRGENHSEVAESLNNLASLHYSQENYAEAVRLYSQSLELLRTLFGESHRDVATALSNLGQALSSQKEYREAEPYLELALKLRQEILGDEHPELANTLNNLGALYVALENYAKAEILYNQALAIRKNVFGLHHLYIANSYNNLARCCYLQDNYSKAEELYSKALGILEDKLGLEHPITKIVQNGLDKTILQIKNT